MTLTASNYLTAINNLDIKGTGKEGHGTVNTKEYENRKNVERRKSCKRNGPTLLYNFEENEIMGGEEGTGGTATASQYIYVDACPIQKVLIMKKLAKPQLYIMPF